jgi:hypothetical protein
VVTGEAAQLTVAWRRPTRGILTGQVLTEKW